MERGVDAVDRVLQLGALVLHHREPLRLRLPLLLRPLGLAVCLGHILAHLLDMEVALAALLVELLHGNVALLHLGKVLPRLLVRAPLQVAQLQHDRLLLGVGALRLHDQLRDLLLRRLHLRRAGADGGEVVEARAAAAVDLRLELAVHRQLRTQLRLQLVHLVAQVLLAPQKLLSDLRGNLRSDLVDVGRAAQRVDVDALLARARLAAQLVQAPLLLLQALTQLLQLLLP